MNRLISPLAISAMLAGGGIASAQSLPGPSDPVEGHRLSLTICSPCHVVATDQEQPPLLEKPGPSFMAVAKTPGVTEESLRHFLLTTHGAMTTKPTYSMPNQHLADYQTNAIVAYLLSLRPKP